MASLLYRILRMAFAGIPPGTPLIMVCSARFAVAKPTLTDVYHNKAGRLARVDSWWDRTKLLEAAQLTSSRERPGSQDDVGSRLSGGTEQMEEEEEEEEELEEEGEEEGGEESAEMESSEESEHSSDERDGGGAEKPSGATRAGGAAGGKDQDKLDKAGTRSAVAAALGEGGRRRAASGEKVQAGAGRQHRSSDMATRAKKARQREVKRKGDLYTVGEALSVLVVHWLTHSQTEEEVCAALYPTERFRPIEEYLEGWLEEQKVGGASACCVCTPGA